MFVKSGTGFGKLLDKKSLRTAVYDDSKGFQLFRIFNACALIILLFFLKNNLIGVHQAQF